MKNGLRDTIPKGWWLTIYMASGTYATKAGSCTYHLCSEIKVCFVTLQKKRVRNSLITSIDAKAEKDDRGHAQNSYLLY